MGLRTLLELQKVSTMDCFQSGSFGKAYREYKLPIGSNLKVGARSYAIHLCERQRRRLYKRWRVMLGSYHLSSPSFHYSCVCYIHIQMLLHILYVVVKFEAIG